MVRKTRTLLDNAFYHVYARGNNRQTVFKKAVDYEALLERLSFYKRKCAARIYGYCPMPTHFHLVIDLFPTIKIQKFMQGLLLSYSSYYRTSYNYCGHVWQGRFQHRIVNKDKYVLDCISYIERNPVRAGLVNTVEEWPWSSYHERVLGKENYSLISEIKLY